MFYLFFIYLYTGTPGSGKTLYVMGIIKKLLSTFRRIYVHAIPGLRFEHQIVVCESKTCDFCQGLKDYDSYKKVKDWSNYADDGDIFIIDEAQHVYRAKGSADVTQFETHRRRGIDFYLITQHPMLISTDLRRLIGKHIHLVADFLGRKQYEWSECSQNLAKTGSIKSKYTLDSSLFDLYHSASLHTKPERKIPPMLYLFCFALVFTLYFGYSVYTRRFSNNENSQPVLVNQKSPVQQGLQNSLLGSSLEKADINYDVLIKTSKIDHMNYYPKFGYKYYFVSGQQLFDSSDLINRGYLIERKSDYEVVIKNASGLSISITR